MEDKELFNFFRTRNASFEEMPSDELWNKIQNTIEIPRKTSFRTILKTIFLITFLLATLATIVFVINKDKNQIFENGTNHPDKIKIQRVLDSLNINTFQESTISSDGTQSTEDTLKKKKVDFKKSTLPLKIGAFTIQNTVIPPLEMDSIKIIDSKILIDTMMINPKAKGSKPFLNSAKLSETMKIPHKEIKDSLIKVDSIYFNMKK
ncbi:MAG: hypothetical protein EOO46_05030 [Flavobacterium sp.]|nr:MAG: hypothetical protein EOO46_05030 [Flavobacterium sp.]